MWVCIQARSQPQKSGGAPVTSKGAPKFEGGVVGEVLRIRGGGGSRRGFTNSRGG